MAKLEGNVVPIIVLDDDSEESGNSMSVLASKLTDSQVEVGFDVKRVENGESLVVPNVGKAVEVENVTPNSGETILVDGFGLKLNGFASLNGCAVSEQEVIDNENSCLIEGKSEKRQFTVGDFVWCKIQNDPWLPAQVCDSKDASEMALRYRQEGKLLVVLFGSGTGSWCSTSQLLPFLENFVEMSRHCNSRIYLKAEQKAIDEFGRIVESDMICKCVPENLTSGLARPMANNGGVKPGVLVPEVKVNQLSVPEYEPFKVLAEVRHFAKTLSVGNKLHLAILKCRLSAFYRLKGGYQLPLYDEPVPLPLYDEPVPIEGLEEMKQMLGPVVNGFSPFPSGDIIYQRRQKKTFFDIMGENVKVEPRSGGSFSAGKKSGKRKVGFLDTNSEIVCDEGVETVPVPRKPEDIDLIAGEDSTVDPKQELHNLCTPRQRKKSKYLSPPFTTLDGNDEELKTKMPFSLSDVEISVNELLVKIQVAAVTPLDLSNKGSFDKVSAFVSAMKSSTYMHGSNYKIRKCRTGPKQKKQLPSRSKLSPAVGTKASTPTKVGSTLTKVESSCKTDGFISDAKFVIKKLEAMTVYLEKNQTKLSVEEKASLKEDIKQIKGSFVNLSEKVEAASQKARLAEEASSG